MTTLSRSVNLTNSYTNSTKMATSNNDLFLSQAKNIKDKVGKLTMPKKIDDEFWESIGAKFPVF